MGTRVGEPCQRLASPCVGILYSSGSEEENETNGRVACFGVEEGRSREKGELSVNHYLLFLSHRSRSIYTVISAMSVCCKAQVARYT